MKEQSIKINIYFTGSLSKNVCLENLEPKAEEKLHTIYIGDYIKIHQI